VSTEENERAGLTQLARRTDFLLAVLAAIAAIGFAWTGYQSASWVRERFDIADSASHANEQAIGLSSEADRIEERDTLLYAEWLAALESGDNEIADRVFELFRPEVREYVDRAGADDGQPPTASLFDIETYSANQRRLEAQALRIESRVLTQEAADASSAAARYSGIGVTFTAVLAATGIAIRFENPRLRRVFIVVSSVLMLGAVVLSVTTSIRFGWARVTVRASRTPRWVACR
jgi:hypothetical protein